MADNQDSIFWLQCFTNRASVVVVVRPFMYTIPLTYFVRAFYLVIAMIHCQGEETTAVWFVLYSELTAW